MFDLNFPIRTVIGSDLGPARTENRNGQSQWLSLTLQLCQLKSKFGYKFVKSYKWDPATLTMRKKPKKRCYCVGPPQKKKNERRVFPAESPPCCPSYLSARTLTITNTERHALAFLLTTFSLRIRNRNGTFFFPFPLEWGGACFVNVLEFFFITMAAEKWVLMVTAQTPTNIAVIKYWGKRDETLILPVNDSISVTLDPDHLCTTTTVAVSPSFDQDRMWLNGKV